MSDKRSKSSRKKEGIKIVEKKEKIPFSVWFAGQKRLGKLQFWQEREISVFFKENGLSEKEEADKYTEVLKLY